MNCAAKSNGAIKPSWDWPARCALDINVKKIPMYTSLNQDPQ
jgi:hypothetical protein